MEETTSCFGVFHHETCKKISAQAQLISDLQDKISVLESTIEVSRTIPNEFQTKKAVEDQVHVLREEFARRDAERESQLDELTRLLLDQCEQLTTAEEAEEELNTLVMEKHELLLTLGQTLTHQEERIRELETAMSINTTGEEKNNLLLFMPPVQKDRQDVVELKTALAEMQAKLHQTQEAAENREFLLHDQIDMLRSVLQLPADWELKRDNSNSSSSSSNSSKSIYFYNNRTNECRRDVPRTQEYMIPSTIPPGTEEGEKTRIEQQPLHENQRPMTKQPPLPENWIAMEDISSNTTYYYNKITGSSQWELPLPPPAPAVGKSVSMSLFRSNKNKR